MRVAVEGCVIVTSILLAFAIDAWWDARLERGVEANALAVLARDLQSADDQLSEFSDFAHDKSEAAFMAFQLMSSEVPEAERANVTDMLNRALFRRTVRLPRSGYTDLVSTGAVRVIRDTDLRDRLLRFYEEAERVEVIIEKNSAQLTDGLLSQALVASGLIVPRPSRSALNDLTVERNEAMEEYLGTDFAFPRDRIWEFTPDSREWAGVRSVLFQLGMFETQNAVLAGRTIATARALRSDVLAHLSSIGKPAS
jgi:hypothetical protein